MAVEARILIGHAVEALDETEEELDDDIRALRALAAHTAADLPGLGDLTAGQPRQRP